MCCGGVPYTLILYDVWSAMQIADVSGETVGNGKLSLPILLKQKLRLMVKLTDLLSPNVSVAANGRDVSRCPLQTPENHRPAYLCKCMRFRTSLFRTLDTDRRSTI